MIKIRKFSDRGRTRIGWLDSYHTFSFGDYYDPQFMGFRHLRVINEDFVQGSKGFDTHPHRDMEIMTYVLEGALAHKDSMGNGSPMKSGEVQIMSAGTGVTHSEFNHSKKELVHLLQIWILPAEKGLNPSYQQKSFQKEMKSGQLCLLVSPTGRNGSLKIHQDAEILAANFKTNKNLEYHLKSNRYAWIQVCRGSLKVNHHLLKQGDGAAFNQEENLSLEALEPTEILLFDLA